MAQEIQEQLEALIDGCAGQSDEKLDKSDGGFDQQLAHDLVIKFKCELGHVTFLTQVGRQGERRRGSITNSKGSMSVVKRVDGKWFQVADNLIAFLHISLFH